MPIILDPDGYDLWLDPGMTNVAAASELLKPYDDRDNPGVRHWWPGFYLAFDALVGFFLAVRLIRNPDLARLAGLGFESK
jgi:hypothetical protein